MVPAPPSPAPPGRQALRRYRENLGYTLLDVARILECDPSKMSRIETGQRGIRAKELSELLGEYGVAMEQQGILALLADPRGAFGWFRDYEDDVLHGALKDYLILETAASHEGLGVRGPGAGPLALLQTRAYARALAEISTSALEDDAARDRAAEAVIARQRAILGEPRPDVHLMIGQAALHQQVGGPQVMNEQLRYAGARGRGEQRHRSRCRSCRSSPARTRQRETGRCRSCSSPGRPGLGLVHLGGIADLWCAWKAGTTSPPTRARSTSCARSRSAPRSRRCCCAAWPATDIRSRPVLPPVPARLRRERRINPQPLRGTRLPEPTRRPDGAQHRAGGPQVPWSTNNPAPQVRNEPCAPPLPRHPGAGTPSLCPARHSPAGRSP